MRSTMDIYLQGWRGRSFMIFGFTFQKRRAQPKETLPSKWRATLLSYLGCFDRPKRQGSTVVSKRL